MAAANAQQTNPRAQFFKAFITLLLIKLIKVTCIRIEPPVEKSMELSI